MTLPDQPAAQPAPEPEPQPEPQPQAPVSEPTPKTEKPQEEPQQEVKYITEEQLNQVIAQTKRDLKQADKQRAKQIKQEVDTLKQRIITAGIQVTPDQEQKLYNQVVDSLDEGEGDTDVQDAISPDDIPPEVMPALEWMNRQNLQITADDPEFKKFLEPVFDVEKLDQADITLAMSQAVNEKRARLGLQQDRATLRTPAAPGSPAVAPLYSPTKSPLEYFEEYERGKQGK